MCVHQELVEQVQKCAGGGAPNDVIYTVNNVKHPLKYNETM